MENQEDKEEEGKDVSYLLLKDPIFVLIFSIFVIGFLCPICLSIFIH